MLSNEEPLSSTILGLVASSSSAQHVRGSSEQLLALRTHPGYLRAMLDLLQNAVLDTEALQMGVLVQFKNGLQGRDIRECERRMLRSLMMGIILRHANGKTHKILRQIVRILTAQIYDEWAEMEKWSEYLQSEAASTAGGLGWIISVLVGAVEACPSYYYSRKVRRPNLAQLLAILSSVLTSIPKNEYQTILYITTFIHQFIYCSSAADVHGLIMQGQLRNAAIIGLEVWHPREQLTAQDIEAIGGTQLEILKTLDDMLAKQDRFSRQECAGSYAYEKWKEPQISQMITFLFNCLQQGKLEGNQKGAYLLKVLNKFVRAVKVPDLIPLVEPLLYVHIPNILYELTGLVLCGSAPMKHFRDRFNNYEVRFKSGVVELWKNLSYIDLAPLHRRSPENNVIRSRQGWTRKVETVLPSYVLHFKFLFQKLSEALTFFSPLSLKKDYIENVLWSHSDENWVIVIFDLLKAFEEGINRPECTEIKQSMPQILLNYVFPKLFVGSPLLQAHAISVLTVFHGDFKALRLTANLVGQLQKMLMSQSSIHTKDVLFRVLPGLAQNKQVHQFVVANIQLIVTGYLDLAELEKGDCQLVQSFGIFVKKYQSFIKKGEEFVNRVIQKFLHYIIDHKEQPGEQGMNIVSYMDCLSNLMKLPLHHNKIRQNFARLVRCSLTMGEDNIDCELVQEELLKIIGDHLAGMPEIISNAHSEELMVFFCAYCISLAGFDRKVMRMFKKEGQHLGSLPQFTKDIKPCEQSMLLGMLWILQAFTLKPSFPSASPSLNFNPVRLYLLAIDCCLERFKFLLTQKMETDTYIEFLYNVLKGLMSVVEDHFEELEDIDAVDICALGIKVYDVSREGIVQQISLQKKRMKQQKKGATEEKEKGKTVKNDLEDSWQQEQKYQLMDKLKRKLAEAWSTFLFFIPKEAQQCLAVRQDFIDSYLILINSSAAVKVERPTYEKRILLGLGSLLLVGGMRDEIRRALLRILLKVVKAMQDRSRSLQIGGHRSWKNGPDSDHWCDDNELKEHDDESEYGQWEETDEQEWEQYEEYDLQEYKDESALDMEDELQSLHEALQQQLYIAFPAFAKQNHQLIEQITDILHFLNGFY